MTARSQRDPLGWRMDVGWREGYAAEIGDTRLRTTARLDVPKNITPIFLPSGAPELNPVENIWQYLRANWLSNRVFDTTMPSSTPHAEAWRKLLAQPETITLIGMRKWAHVGQSS